jgi:hypothetical protein
VDSWGYGLNSSDILSLQQLSTLTDWGTPIRMKYRNGSGEISWRKVDPISFYSARNGYSYLRAYCRLREEERTFRFDRILEYSLCDKDKNSPENNKPRILRETGCSQSNFHQKEDSENHYDQTPIRRVVYPSRSVSYTTGNPVGNFLRFIGKGLAAGLIIAFVRYGIIGEDLSRELSRSYPPVISPIPESAPPPGQVHYPINIEEFRKATGIRSAYLEHFYSSADSDKNGHLSWNEIKQFQRNLERKYQYKPNQYALRPDQFLAQGGGDCEDWALVTCGLLRFWGWNCKVASFAPKSGGTGHAIAMVWSEKPVKGIGYLYLPEGTTLGCIAVRPGYYIQIDYNHVGSLSNAVGKSWVLRALYEPEKIYGLLM